MAGTIDPKFSMSTDQMRALVQAADLADGKADGVYEDGNLQDALLQFGQTDAGQAFSNISLEDMAAIMDSIDEEFGVHAKGLQAASTNREDAAEEIYGDRRSQDWSGVIENNAGNQQITASRTHEAAGARAEIYANQASAGASTRADAGSFNAGAHLTSDFNPNANSNYSCQYSTSPNIDSARTSQELINDKQGFMSQVDSQRAEVDNIKGFYQSSVDQAKEAYEAELAKQEVTDAQGNDLKATREAKNQEIEAQQATIDGIKQSMTDMDTQITAANDAKTAAQEQQTAANEQMTTANQNMSTATTAMSNAQTQMSGAQSQMSDAQAQLQAAQAQARNAGDDEGAKQAAAQAVTAAQQAIAAAQQAIQAAQQAISDAQNQITSAEAEIAAAEEAIAQADQAVADAEQNISDLTEQKAQLETDISTQEDIMEGLQAELTEIDNQIHEAVPEGSDVQKALEAYQTAQANQNAAVSAAQADLRTMEQNIGQYDSAINNAKQREKQMEVENGRTGDVRVNTAGDVSSIREEVGLSESAMVLNNEDQSRLAIQQAFPGVDLSNVNASNGDSGMYFEVPVIDPHSGQTIGTDFYKTMVDDSGTVQVVHTQQRDNKDAYTNVTTLNNAHAQVNWSSVPGAGTVRTGVSEMTVVDTSAPKATTTTTLGKDGTTATTTFDRTHGDSDATLTTTTTQPDGSSVSTQWRSEGLGSSISVTSTDSDGNSVTTYQDGRTHWEDSEGTHNLTQTGSIASGNHKMTTTDVVKGPDGKTTEHTTTTQLTDGQYEFEGRTYYVEGGTLGYRAGGPNSLLLCADADTYNRFMEQYPEAVSSSTSDEQRHEPTSKHR
ncbi:MAG: hypothetical protein IJ877_03725 [Candidatus Gastranaerophilales bacterium]|nr:hypothetical protein [Candidatus Gastranaerophilales bacterium]